MAVQFRRRDSRGWVDEGCEVVVWERRRVSGRPGAEGAPLGWVVVVVVDEEEVVVLVLEVVLAWEEGGAMRRD